MWTDITYKCGHTGRIQLYGSASERDNKAAWYSNNVMCSACQAIKREADNAAAAASAKDAGLPELTGSAKQVEWANTIRQGAIDKLSGMAKTDRDRATISSLVRIVTSASEWIDSRDNLVSLIRRHSAEIKAEIGE